MAEAMPPTTGPLGATAAEASAPPASPQGYELLDQIGHGGMGVVYRARDAALDRDVAVKLLSDRIPADSPAAQRFLSEARITGQLQHPGIPAVHQVGTLADGRPFLAMKLVKGRTLDALLKNPGPSSPNLLAVFEHVCQTVGYAHAHAVIHRDLKPANVMVGAFGEVQVMDWGLAKVLGAAADRGEPSAGEETAAATAIDSDRGEGDATRAGSVLGTPAYMPPEQAIGAVDQVDARSDVFGLGAILCAILTGKPPYVAADAEATRQLAARAKLEDAYARLDASGAEPGLVALCKRCLAAEKPERPADAGVVAQAVADLRAAAEERARQAELDRVRAEGERAKAEAEAREQRKRRRMQLALAAALGLLLIGGGAFAWYSDRQATQRRIEEELRERDEKARLGRNAEALAALVRQCEDALRADDSEKAALALEAAEKRAAEGGAEESQARLARCRADLALLRELDDIDSFRWARAETGQPALKTLADRWRNGLAVYGLVPGATPAEEAADHVNRSLVRERLLTALDLWLTIEPSPGLRSLLRSTDPDPYRDGVRDAIAARDARAVALQATRPEALAQPLRFAVVLGQLPDVPVEGRRAWLESAVRAWPRNINVLMTLALSYRLDNGEGTRERVRWLQAGVAVQPGNAAAHTDLGMALLDKGDKRGAVAECRAAVRLAPKFAIARNNLATALESAGDVDGALAECRDAVRVIPTDARLRNNLAIVLLKIGDIEHALTENLEAVRIDPKFAPAHNNLAWLLATGPDSVRDGKRAVEHATRAGELSGWTEPTLFDTLAAAHAEAGDFDKAIEYQKKALSFPAFEKAHGREGRGRLELYARKKPYRDQALVPAPRGPDRPPREVKGP
jgi:predicted ribosomally synthesized peptide with SipW-like signal peptide